MTRQDEHEIEYWRNATPEILKEEEFRLRLMLSIFPLPAYAGSVLEIGVGPQGGLLRFISAPRKVGIEPLASEYLELGFPRPDRGVEVVEEYFEKWESSEKFDVIVCTNALDHGEMGFHTLGAIDRRLNPAGEFYLHVHLRPAELLNAGHNHSLTVAQLDRELEHLPNWRQQKREFYDNDVDGKFRCRALVGVWRKSLYA